MVNQHNIPIPTILVPKWIDVQRKAEIGISGRMGWELFERHGDREVVVRSGEQHNKVLDTGITAFYTAWFTTEYFNGLNVCLANNRKGYASVGTGTTEPALTDIALVNRLVTKAGTKTIEPNEITSPNVCQWSYEFAEAEGNGDLAEWAIGGSLAGTTLWCRELFRDENGNPVVVTKTDQQALRIVYTITITTPAVPSVASIATDGTTYECTTYITEKAKFWLLSKMNYDERPAGTIFKNGLVAGASNAATDMVNDIPTNMLKGAAVGFVTDVGASAPRTITPNPSNAFKQSQSYSIGGAFLNGSIGEMLTCRYVGNTITYGCLARTTFNPPLIKTSDKKLYFGIEWIFADV